MPSFRVCQLTKAPPPRVILHTLPRAWERVEAAHAAGDQEAERAARNETFDLAMLLAYLTLTPVGRATWHESDMTYMDAILDTARAACEPDADDADALDIRLLQEDAGALC